MRKVYGPMLTIGFSVIITGTLLVQSVYPVITMDEKLDMTNDLYGWTEVGAKIQAEYDEMSKDGQPVVFTRRLLMAGQIRFYTPGHIPAYSISGVHEQYDLWGRGTLEGLPRGTNGIFVANNKYQPGNVDEFGFERCDALPTIDIKRRNRVVRQFYLFRCKNYLGE